MFTREELTTALRTASTKDVTYTIHVENSIVYVKRIEYGQVDGTTIARVEGLLPPDIRMA